MIKFLAYRKFNYIDMSGGSFGAIKLFEGGGLQGIVIIIATVIISVTCERIAETDSQ